MKRVFILFKKILLALPAMLGVLILRILRPLVVIRLGGIDISRIGNMYKADWYLSECLAGMHGGKNFDIFYFTAAEKIVCNQQWVKMWKRTLRTVPFGSLFKMINRLSVRFPGHKEHILSMNHVSTITTPHKERLKCILKNKKSHIAFTQPEEMFGLQALRELGILEKKPFICFHARDSAYLDAVYPGKSWRYHDYRDSSIGNYIPAAEEITQKGYCAIRLGAVVKEKLEVTNPNIIDYACNGKRTDFLDVYLGAKCEFFICSDTGISIIPEIFRRPVVYVNWAPIRRVSPWVLRGLFIFKKFFSHKRKRFLTFSELIKIQFDGPENKNFFNEEEIEFIENTPEEIIDVAIEMEERLKGKWETTQEDEELQQRFWALFGPDQLKSPDVRVGAKFLRQNEHLLSESLIESTDRL